MEKLPSKVADVYITELHLRETQKCGLFFPYFLRASVVNIGFWVWLGHAV